VKLLNNFTIDGFNWNINLSLYNKYPILKAFLISQLEDEKCERIDHGWWEAFSPSETGDEESNKEFFKELFDCEVPTDGLTDILYIMDNNEVYVWKLKLSARGPQQGSHDKLNEELAAFVKTHGEDFLKKEIIEAVKIWMKTGLTKEFILETVDAAIVGEVMED